VWIFLVPLIAKRLSNSEKGINLILQKSPELSISLSVPFNWNLFYFAALLYVIGNIIYFWKAPEVIKNYDNFKDFEEKDKSGFLIMNSVENFLDDHNEYNDYLNQVYYYFKWRHNIELPEPDEREELKNELMMRINDDRLSNLFAISASFIDRKRLPSRAFSTALYSFSVCLYGYVIIEQSVFVFTEFFSHYSFS
jgi:hypothetical protein